MHKRTANKLRLGDAVSRKGFSETLNFLFAKFDTSDERIMNPLLLCSNQSGAAEVCTYRLFEDEYTPLEQRTDITEDKREAYLTARESQLVKDLPNA